MEYLNIHVHLLICKTQKIDIKYIKKYQLIRKMFEDKILMLIFDIRDLFRDQKHGNITVTQILIEITIKSGFQYLLENWTIGQNLPSSFYYLFCYLF